MINLLLLVQCLPCNDHVLSPVKESIQGKINREDQTSQEDNKPKQSEEQTKSELNLNPQ